MATRTSSLAQDNNSNANWQAWVNEIDAAFIAFGWTRSGDTGEASMPTATGRPTTTNLYPIWVVYKMGDALQSSAPVVVRIDFGTGPNIADQPGIKYQVGIGGTNGAGVITGTGNFQSQVIPITNTAGTALNNCRISGNSSSIQISMWAVLGSGFGLFIERDKDATGANTADGVCVASFNVGVSQTLSMQTQFIPTAGYTSNSGFAGIADTIWHGLTSTQSTQTAGGNTGVGNVRCQYGKFRNPMLGLCVNVRTDFTMEATFSTTIYGSSHTYLQQRPKATAGALNTLNSDCGFGMLWE